MEDDGLDDSFFAYVALLHLIWKGGPEVKGPKPKTFTEIAERKPQMSHRDAADYIDTLIADMRGYLGLPDHAFDLLLLCDPWAPMETRAAAADRITERLGMVIYQAARRPLLRTIAQEADSNGRPLREEYRLRLRSTLFEACKVCEGLDPSSDATWKKLSNRAAYLMLIDVWGKDWKKRSEASVKLINYDEEMLEEKESTMSNAPAMEAEMLLTDLVHKAGLSKQEFIAFSAHFDEESMAELARRLGKKESTARVQLMNARAKMQKFFDQA